MTERRPERPSGQDELEPEPLPLDEVIKAVGGRLLCGDADRVACGVSVDSRTIRERQLFFALKGVHHDGHDFVPEALRKGASAAIVEEGRLSWGVGNLIAVPDTLTALGDLAAHVRSKFPIPLVAVTGSNGKTTTKGMLSEILSVSKQALSSKGSFNNFVGLPLTLMGLSRGHQVAVVELGMNRPGEIKRLSEICRPEVGVVTNIGPVHLEGVKDIDGVARAKGEILCGLKEGGIMVFNGDDPYCIRTFSPLLRGGQAITFGVKGDGLKVRAKSFQLLGTTGLRLTIDVAGDSLEVDLKVSGAHNMENALAATAAAYALGVPLGEIKEGLKRFRPIDGRTNIIPLQGGITLIDDSYNANPRSMEMALNLLKDLAPGRKVALLADMLELGEAAGWSHLRLGRQAARAGIDHLLFLGRYGNLVEEGAITGGMDRVTLCQDHEEALKAILTLLKEGDFLLIKGSRAMGLDRVVERLRQREEAG